MINKKNWYKELWLIWISVIIILATIIIYCYSDRARNIFQRIIIDSNGDFMWSSITSITAIIALIATWYNNQNSIKANVINKSRIEWIQEVRRLAADFLEDCYTISSSMYILKLEESKSEKVEEGSGIIAKASIEINEEKGINTDFYNKEKNEFLKKQSEIRKKGELLILYLGPDNSGNNDFIVSLIEGIINTLSKEDKIFEGLKEAVDKALPDLKNILRVYFKVEWNRATGKIKDYEVDEYLNKDSIYLEIKERYEDALK